ncbi:hypothetical protein [Streptomyces sp. NBC_00582]|uniref:hypothetical protein n=1 Tax=Streptomyces sp. NBC_00582 TaxID=2975783 RepID=UPI00106248B7|nr:hypothetical protein [Streptomyces sp. NBC_00582]WUB66642.1 hypothetical protein OG852_42635 [Streptomyces sp. NBC_00582]
MSQQVTAVRPRREAAYRADGHGQPLRRRRTVGVAARRRPSDARATGVGPQPPHLVTSVAAPTSPDFTDGFADEFTDEEGKPDPALPTMNVRVRPTPHGDGTRMKVRWSFETREQMDRLVEMGMAEARGWRGPDGRAAHRLISCSAQMIFPSPV